MRYEPVARLSVRALWFPLFLVLFEFSTYIANDMILPGMLQVVDQFQASSAWVPTAMTMYLLGGASLQWLLGPWSDRAGRRPVMLWGVVIFILTTLLICFVKNIEQFMLMRIVQGTGMCFVGAVGYAAIQEAFTERTAIRVTAMMINVAMLAPLIGPITGAAVLAWTTWQMIFVAIALLALISGVGLYFCMPETSPKKYVSLKPLTLWSSYKVLLKNPTFMLGVIAAGFAWMPLLAWIGQSPVFIMEAAGQTTRIYGLWQLPVMGAVIIGSIILAMQSDRMNVKKMIMGSAYLSLIGLVASVIFLYLFAAPFEGAAIGLTVYALGLGLSNAALYRITLFSSGTEVGLASAAYGLIALLMYAIGLEACKWFYEWWQMLGFVTANLILGVVYVVILLAFFRYYIPAAESSSTS